MLVFNQLLSRTRARISTLYFKYCTFSLVSLVLRHICHENDWSVARIRFPISKGFSSLPPLTEGCGTPSRCHPGGRESCLHGIQQPYWQADTHLLVSSFRMHDSLLPPLVRYTNMAWSFGSGFNIFSLTSSVNRKALKKNLSNYYGYINITTVDKVCFLADSSLYRFIRLLVYTGKQATHTM